jgi:hypothetical protein
MVLHYMIRQSKPGESSVITRPTDNYQTDTIFGEPLQ